MAFEPQKVGKSLTTAGDATASTGEKLITASKFMKRVARALSADEPRVHFWRRRPVSERSRTI